MTHRSQIDKIRFNIILQILSHRKWVLKLSKNFSGRFSAVVCVLSDQHLSKFNSTTPLIGEYKNYGNALYTFSTNSN